MAVELGSGGLMSVGTPKQQAGALFKTPTKRSRGSSSSSRRAAEAAARARAEAAKKAAEEAAKKAAEKKLAEEKAAADKLRQDMILARRANNKALEAAKAVELRENLTRQAQLRGRAFTKSEARRFLGGGAGVKALRAGTRAEREYFRKTGVSLSQEREKLRQRAELMKGVSFGKVVAETLPSQRSGYVRVRLPNGKIEEVRSSGQTNFSKSYAGQKVVVRDGQVVSVGDSNVNKVKTGTFSIYVKPSAKDFIKTKVKVGASNVSAKARDLAKSYEKDIEQDQKILNKTKGSDIARIQEITRKVVKGEATKADIAERQRLEKQVAKNYRLAGDFVVKTIYVSLINLGVGSVELLSEIRKNPAVILALPSAIVQGVKDDFNRVLSGDPLEASRVGLEYWSYGKAFGALGKTTKTSFAVARQLSPKYFGPIANKLKIPPLTGTLAKITTPRIKDIIKRSTRNVVGSKNFNKLTKSLRANRQKVNARIDSALSQARKVKRSRKFIAKEAREPFVKADTLKKIKTDYKKSLNRAKKIRQQSQAKYRTIQPKTPDYQKAIKVAENIAESAGEIKARTYIMRYIERGGKITAKQADDFVKGVKNYYLETLQKLPEYKQMVRYDKLARNSAIKLIKQNKILAAKAYLKKIIEKINNVKAVKVMNDVLSKVKRGVSVTKRKVVSKTKKVKKKIESKKIRRKTNKEYKNALLAARRARALARKKGKTIKVGNENYALAIDFSYEVAENLSKLRARQVIDRLKKAGVKLTKNQQDEIFRLSKKQAREYLEGLQSFKNIQRGARLFRPDAIRLVKVGKLKVAKQYLKSVKSSMQKAPIAKNIASRISKARAKVKRVSPKKIKSKVKRAAARRDAVQRFKQTNRYLMEKNRPIRTVTIEQLKRTNTITNANKVVDRLFEEISRRRKVDVTSVKYSQMKNILKKRLAKAIKTNNQKDLRIFKEWMRKTVKDLNSPQKKLSIKAVQTSGKAKRVKTIKDFEPVKPKGTYKEVRVGDQILLQEVKTAPLKQVQKQVTKQAQKLRVVQVLKPTFSMTSLARAIASSIGAQIAKTIPATSFKTNQVVKFVVKSGQKQDFNVITNVLQKSNSAVAAAVLKDIKKRPATATKQTQIRRTKKPVVRPSLPKGFSRKKLSRPTPTYYVIVKRRGKWVKLMAKPLLKNDARDYLAYSIDNGLERSAFFVPVGKHKETAKLPARMIGYYSKTSNKLRPYKIRMGKKKQLLDGYIEKSKYIQDTRRERAQLSRARAKKKVVRKAPKRTRVKGSIKKRPVKRKTTKKKVVKRKKR